MKALEAWHTELDEMNKGMMQHVKKVAGSPPQCPQILRMIKSGYETFSRANQFGSFLLVAVVFFAGG